MDGWCEEQPKVSEQEFSSATGNVLPSHSWLSQPLGVKYSRIPGHDSLDTKALVRYYLHESSDSFHNIEVDGILDTRPSSNQENIKADFPSRFPDQLPVRQIHGPDVLRFITYAVGAGKFILVNSHAQDGRLYMEKTWESEDHSPLGCRSKCVPDGVGEVYCLAAYYEACCHSKATRSEHLTNVVIAAMARTAHNVAMSAPEEVLVCLAIHHEPSQLTCTRVGLVKLWKSAFKTAFKEASREMVTCRLV